MKGARETMKLLVQVHPWNPWQSVEDPEAGRNGSPNDFLAVHSKEVKG